MNKRVLIISPYFPPSNAADMHRVRMSLPYFRDFGWDAEVVAVDPYYSDLAKDELLTQSIPTDIKIHLVKAFDKRWTSKIGLGSIALRSLLFYQKTVNELLRHTKFDLIYFSTTQFPICILGAYWKRKFGIRYVIDMQDPWHSEYYLDKPKHERPPKYWFSYRLNKWLEPVAMKRVDGLITVSNKYVIDLKDRYKEIKEVISATIPFGASGLDLEIASQNYSHFKNLLDPGYTNVVYIGRGGADMHRAIRMLFEAVKAGMTNEPELFRSLKFYFIGTSYAPEGTGKETIMPLAKEFGIEENVIELTDRISFYHTLATLRNADALFIPGSDDPAYSASKIYPYLLASKLLLAIFDSASPAMDILKNYGVKFAYSYDSTDNISLKVVEFLKDLVNDLKTSCHYNEDAKKKYDTENTTRQQCYLFDKVLTSKI